MDTLTPAEGSLFDSVWGNSNKNLQNAGGIKLDFSHLGMRCPRKSAQAYKIPSLVPTRLVLYYLS